MLGFGHRTSQAGILVADAALEGSPAHSGCSSHVVLENAKPRSLRVQGNFTSPEIQAGLLCVSSMTSGHPRDERDLPGLAPVDVKQT